MKKCISKNHGQKYTQIFNDYLAISQNLDIMFRPINSNLQEFTFFFLFKNKIYSLK